MSSEWIGNPEYIERLRIAGALDEAEYLFELVASGDFGALLTYLDEPLRPDEAIRRIKAVVAAAKKSGDNV